MLPNKMNKVLSTKKMQMDGIILWEAHRAGGGGVERPESCMLSFDYGWSFGGRPEADVHATKDGVIVSVHVRGSTASPASSRPSCAARQSPN